MQNGRDKGTEEEKKEKKEEEEEEEEEADAPPCFLNATENQTC